MKTVIACLKKNKQKNKDNPRLNLVFRAKQVQRFELRIHVNTTVKVPTTTHLYYGP